MPSTVRLRADLDVLMTRDGTAQIRDGLLLWIHELPSDDWKAAQALDGPPLNRAPQAAPPAPWSQVEPAPEGRRRYAKARGAPRWSCGACGACCRGLTVEVTPAEEARIDPALYSDVLDDGVFTKDEFIDPELPAARVLRHRPDGGCIFLGDDDLCLIHRRQGAEFKPDPCRTFPLVGLVVPNGPARLTLRANCATMYESFESGAVIEDADLVQARAEVASLSAPARVQVFERRWSFARWDRLCDEVMSAFEQGGLAAGLRAIDQASGGRMRRRRAAFARAVLGAAPETGPAHPRLERIEAMADGLPPPDLLPRTEAYLVRQVVQAVYAQGPLQVPDAGYGLTALGLAMEGVMHVVGSRGRLPGAHRAFVALSGPLLEDTAQVWPYLEGVAPRWAARLKKEL